MALSSPLGPAASTFSSHRNPVSLELLWLLAAALTPLWVNLAAAQPFELSKVLLLRCLVWPLAGLWLLAAVSAPRPFWQRLRENPLLLPVSLLASITIASTLLAADARLSLWGNYHRAQGLVTQLTYLLLFLVVSSRLRSLPQLQRLTTAMVATGIPIVLLGLAQRGNTTLKRG